MGCRLIVNKCRSYHTCRCWFWLWCLASVHRYVELKNALATVRCTCNLLMTSLIFCWMHFHCLHTIIIYINSNENAFDECKCVYVRVMGWQQVKSTESYQHDGCYGKFHKKMATFCILGNVFNCITISRLGHIHADAEVVLKFTWPKGHFFWPVDKDKIHQNINYVE